ncbi:hypothetical protein ACSBLW_08795 [Thioclava sp. FR2]|uniref:hypothetical protein n=1 Tax=Thioclava sp. FR2 TaxID=3445780 RepID=UPI003EBEF7CE
MTRKLTDLGPVEVAIIDHLYDLTDPLDFNEYLQAQHNAEVDAAFWQMINTGEPIASASEVRWELLRRTLDRCHPDPETILNPSLRHRAFAGLKGLVVYASEVHANRPGLLAHLLSETDTGKVAPEQAADFLLKILVHETLFDRETEAPSNPYRHKAEWQPEGKPRYRELPKAEIWAFVQEALWGGIVGITEQMPDALIRGRFAVAWGVEKQKSLNSG